MSDVVDFPGRGGRGGGEGTAVSVVSIVKSKYLAPDMLRRKMRPALELAFPGSARQALLDHRSPAAVPVARGWLQVIPSEQELKSAEAIFDLALTEQAEIDEVELCVAWLVDSFPNRPAAAGDAFCASLELVLEDADDPLSVAVIAAGMRELIRTSRFLPVGAEVVAAAEKARKRFWAAHHRIQHLTEMRWSAEDTLFRSGKMTVAEYRGDDPFADSEVPF